ncbi:MAG: hypothetical protein Kow00121_39420 [Elainellaceae cyanobacterium]
MEKLWFSLSTALATALTVVLSPLPTLADSTADLLVSLNCDDYYVEVWQNRTSGDYLYRAQGFTGSLSLDQGSREATEGVVVYKFENGDYEYWVWDGSLDSPDEGQLAVYRNNQQLMQRSCRK